MQLQGDTASASEPTGADGGSSPVQLTATKLTGDVSVPAGEVTFEIELGSASDEGVGVAFQLPREFESDVDLSAPGVPKLVLKERIGGRARIAMLGLTEPQWIPAEILVFSVDCFALLWYQLNSLSLFCRMAL